MSDFLNVKQTARRLNLSKKEVEKLCEDGKLGFWQEEWNRWVISLDELLEFANQEESSKP